MTREEHEADGEEPDGPPAPLRGLSPSFRDRDEAAGRSWLRPRSRSTAGDTLREIAGAVPTPPGPGRGPRRRPSKRRWQLSSRIGASHMPRSGAVASPGRPRRPRSAFITTSDRSQPSGACLVTVLASPPSNRIGTRAEARGDRFLRFRSHPWRDCRSRRPARGGTVRQPKPRASARRVRSLRVVLPVAVQRVGAAVGKVPHSSQRMPGHFAAVCSATCAFTSRRCPARPPRDRLSVSAPLTASAPTRRRTVQ